MRKPYVIIISVAAICLAAFVAVRACLRQDPEVPEQITSEEHDRTRDMAAEAKAWCEKNDYDTDCCFLADFSIHSGCQRFFVWDFAADSAIVTSLCAHGYGQGSTKSQPVFSNVEGSYCSSLGKYKIGDRSYSNWGINVHYKMHGLEETNNNAYRRIVVLHSYDPVPDSDIYPLHLPLGMSQGCPVISNEAMTEIDALMKGRRSKKPVLLWIYN